MTSVGLLETLADAAALAQDPAATALAPNFDWLQYVMRAGHILSAITLAGAIFYQCAVAIPVAQRWAGNTRDMVDRLLLGTWSKLLIALILVLLVSGFYNYFAKIRLAREGVLALPKFYHPVIGTKIVLALVIFFIASVLSGRSAAAERFRQHAPRWLTVNSFLAIVVVCLACLLSVSTP